MVHSFSGPAWSGQCEVITLFCLFSISSRISSDGEIVGGIRPVRQKCLRRADLQSIVGNPVVVQNGSNGCRDQVEHLSVVAAAFRDLNRSVDLAMVGTSTPTTTDAFYTGDLHQRRAGANLEVQVNPPPTICMVSSSAIRRMV